MPGYRAAPNLSLRKSPRAASPSPAPLTSPPPLRRLLLITMKVLSLAVLFIPSAMGQGLRAPDASSSTAQRLQRSLVPTCPPVSDVFDGVQHN